MTDAERVLLADIERQLVSESPELHRLLAGMHAAQARRARRVRRAWWWAGAAAVLAAVVLLVVGVAVGVPGLAVAAVCPPALFLALLAAHRLSSRSAQRRRS